VGTVRRRVRDPGGRQPQYGRAVQVSPVKPTLNALGTKRLKLKCVEAPSNIAFNFNLRRYSMMAFARRLARVVYDKRDVDEEEEVAAVGRGGGRVAHGMRAPDAPPHVFTRVY